MKSTQQHWRLRKARYRLVGSVCKCGHKAFPARPVCPACGRHQSIFPLIQLSSRIRIVTKINLLTLITR